MLISNVHCLIFSLSVSWQPHLIQSQDASSHQTGPPAKQCPQPQACFFQVEIRYSVIASTFCFKNNELYWHIQKIRLVHFIRWLLSNIAQFPVFSLRQFKRKLDTLLQWRFPQWVHVWGLLCWVAVYRKRVDFCVSPYQAHKAQQFLFSATLSISPQPSIPFEVVLPHGLDSHLLLTLIGTVLSPHLSTAAVTHPPFFSRSANVALMRFTWLPSRPPSVVDLFCYFALSSLKHQCYWRERQGTSTRAWM